ncbi:L-asparaginase [Spirochaetia bacterium]|nr:L-asparaginase [Spirochaetia bacterium]
MAVTKEHEGRVIVFTTGGTIAMANDSEKGGSVPVVTGQDLIRSVPPLAAVCDVEVREFANIPSGHMTFELMKKLGDQIDEALEAEDVLGAVVTHGTDTLEETAYFLDLYLKTKKPVCCTAAMRNAEEVSADGPINILSAVRTASADEATDMGVFVVLNEQIQAAREVTKTHSGNVATFDSPFWGPLGYVDEDRIIFRRVNLKPLKIHPPRIENDIHLIKTHTGIDDFFFNCLIQKKAKGIVVEGLGRGNVPPKAMEGIKNAVKAGIPVVIATRCLGGRVAPVYAYEGGIVQVLAAGAVSAGELNGQKARIKLGLVLGLNPTPKDISVYFDNP